MIEELRAYVHRWSYTGVGLAILCVDGLTMAFLEWCMDGLVGMGLDLDHIPRMLFVLFPQDFPGFASFGGRWAHRPIYQALGVLVVCSFSLAAGWSFITIRRSHREEEPGG